MNPLVARMLKSAKPFRSYEHPKKEIEVHYLENGLKRPPSSPPIFSTFSDSPLPHSNQIITPTFLYLSNLLYPPNPLYHPNPFYHPNSLYHPNPFTSYHLCQPRLPLSPTLPVPPSPSITIPNPLYHPNLHHSTPLHHL